MGHIRAITGAGSGGKSSGGSGRVAQEDPNTLRSTTIARIIDLISAGPIQGLVEYTKGVHLNDTVFQNADGTYNFTKSDEKNNVLLYQPSVVIEERKGEPDQDYVTGFADAVTPLVVNVEIKKNAPLVRTLPGPIDAARLTFSLPALTYQDPSTGDLHGTSVSLRIYKRPNGTSTWTTVRDVPISGKCVSTYQFSVRVELGGTSDWDIKVERLTDDSTKSNLQNKTWWATTALVTDGKFIYPNTAYVALAADAQHFGSSVPKRAYKVQGRLVRIPSNYNPDTRAYTGLWDGEFITGWTDNPAWVLYDLLTDIFGLGRYIDEAYIDKWSLYTIAQYCDELVPDGFGSMEPRFTFNYQITSQEDAYKVIQSVASVFRGMSYWATGSVFFVADMPSDPVALVTNANVIGGMFTYEGTGHSARHSAVMVTWFDPDDMCRPAIEVVEDPDLIAEFGWRQAEIIAYACTSRGQAHRLGKWLLDTERYATETVNYEAAWDHLTIAPGDIVEVYDQDYAGIRMSGRLAASSANSVTIDKEIEIEAGKTYTLTIPMPDNSLVKRVLTNNPGQALELTFDETIDALPVEAATWGVSVDDLKPRQFRVISVKELSEGRFAVSALFHDPDKYDRVERDIKLEPRTYSKFSREKPPAPVGLTVKEYVYRYAASLRPAATLTWDPAPDPTGIVAYEIEYRRADGNWASLLKTTGTSADMKDAEAGEWQFRVRAYGFNGLYSDWFLKTVDLFGLAAAPSDVQNFTMAALGDIAMLSWDPNGDLDLSHYRIKYAAVSSGATWESAIDLVPKVTGVSVQVPVMVGTYLIKAIDLSGSESTNATAVVTTVASVDGFQPEAAISDWPNWDGLHNGTVKDGNLLKLQDGKTSGIYTLRMSSANVSPSALLSTSTDILTLENVLDEGNILGQSGIFDLGETYDSVRLSALIDAYGARRDNIWQNLGLWKSLGKWSDVETSAWGVRIQLRRTLDDPSDPNAVWTDWADLTVGDYAARAFMFRLILTSVNDNITPVVADVTLLIDMPKRLVSESGISVPVEGKEIIFANPFRATPAVGITIQNAQSGDTFEYTAGPTPYGFTFICKNQAGSPVARTVDCDYGGWGRVL